LERYVPREANTERIDSVRSVLAERASTDLKDKALLAAHDLRVTFGVRAKESLMSSKTVEKDGKQYLQIEGSKGGRPRMVEIRTPEQAQAVEQVRSVAAALGNPTGRIIPTDMSLKQMYDYQRNTLAKLGATKANGANMHVVRHAWAQERLRDTGDRKLVAEDLGHGRESVTAHYAK
jgi:site-specific recombinase XerD